MALPATTVLEVRTGASDNNGGGFVTGETGTDYSQQDAAQASLTTASTVHTTTTQINVAVADFTVSSLDVGNLLQIINPPGTATAGVYRITTADVPNNRWTLDRSAGTSGQTVVGSMGGAFATPGKASGITTVAGMIVWVKSGTYNISSTTANVANGRVTLGVANTRMSGYQNTRGDLTGVRPLFLATVNTMTLVAISNELLFGNINLSAGSATGIAGISASAGAIVHDVRMTGANATAGLLANTNSVFIRCEATGGTVNGFQGAGGSFYGCVASAVGGRGFAVSGSDLSSFIRCISTGNTGGSGKGFDMGTLTGSALYVNCVANSNAQTGFDNTGGGNQSVNWINCISWDNAGDGFDEGHAWSCAAGSNLEDFDATTIQHSTITLTADPFVDAIGLDFALNDKAGGGAACRGMGMPGAFPSLVVTTSYPDIGCAQHQDGTAPGPVNSLHALFALPRGWDVES